MSSSVTREAAGKHAVIHDADAAGCRADNSGARGGDS